MGKRKNQGILVKVILAVVMALIIAAIIVAFSISHRGHDKEPFAGEETATGSQVADSQATDTQEAEPKADMETDSLAGRNIYFSGIKDAIISRETVVQLDNREENLDFLLRYEVYGEDGSLVFETNLIPSGQHVDWIPGETLGAGEHPLCFLQIPYCTGGDGVFTVLTRGRCQTTLVITD